MSAETAMLRGQLAAVALMVDACQITRRSTQTTNPDTGVITQNYSVIYTGICRIQRRTMFDRPHSSGEAYVYMLAVEVQLPISAIGPTTEDIVTVTTATYDPDLLSRVFTVRGLSHKTHATARHLQCVEINS